MRKLLAVAVAARALLAAAPARRRADRRRGERRHHAADRHAAVRLHRALAARRRRAAGHRAPDHRRPGRRPVREDLRGQPRDPHARAGAGDRARHGDRARRARAGGPRRDPVRARAARVRADPGDRHPAREHHDRRHPHALVHRPDLADRLDRLRGARRRRLRPARLRVHRAGDRARRSWSRTRTACPRSSASARRSVTNASRNRNFEPFKRNEDVPKDEAAREGGVDRPAADRDPRGRARRPPDRRVVELRRSTRRPSATRTSSSPATTPSFTERIVEPKIRTARAQARDARAAAGDGRERLDELERGRHLARRRAPTRTAGSERRASSTAATRSRGAHMAGHEGRARAAEGLAQGREGDDGRHAARLAARLRGLRRQDGRRRAGRPERRARRRAGSRPTTAPARPFDGFAGPGQGMKMPLLGGPGDSLVPGTQPVA